MNLKYSSKQILQILIPLAFYSLLFFFLAVYLRSVDLSVLGGISIYWGYLGLATILGLAFRYWGAYIWTVLLRSLGANSVKFNRELVYVYAKSWLGRYIPGTAPWILGKIYFASKQGISKNKLAVSSLLEGILQIVVQMLLSFALIGLDPRLNILTPELRALILVAIIACLVVLLPPVFNRLVSVAYRVVKRKRLSEEHFASNGTILTGFGLYVVGSIVSGLSLFFVAKGIYPELGYDSILFVMGAGTLAGAASMLAFFAPGGIGVREGIQLVLLGLIMPVEYALAITVLTRLWSVAVDFLFYALASVAKAHRRSPTR